MFSLKVIPKELSRLCRTSIRLLLGSLPLFSQMSKLLLVHSFVGIFLLFLRILICFPTTWPIGLLFVCGMDPFPSPLSLWVFYLEDWDDLVPLFGLFLYFYPYSAYIKIRKTMGLWACDFISKLLFNSFTYAIKVVTTVYSHCAEDTKRGEVTGYGRMRPCAEDTDKIANWGYFGNLS